MFSKEFLAKEVYDIPLSDGNTLIYAPLTRFFAIYEGAVTVDEIMDEIADEAISSDKIPTFIKERGFTFDSSKIRLRLNITPRCNLQCLYCSVNAKSESDCKKDMSNSIAFAAIRFFINYAVEHTSTELEIVFSGGEPTIKMRQMKEIIFFTLNEVKGKSIKISFRLITNGLFSWSAMKSIAHYFKEIQVSWDGAFLNHPRYGEHYVSLSNKVLHNISQLLKIDIPVSVLTVVTEQNYRIIREIVDALYVLGVRHIFLSLEDSLGRAKDHDVQIDVDKFTSLYLDLWKYYRECGVDINLGGTDIHSISPLSCSVPIPNYSISPNGDISSCTTTFNDSSDAVKSFRIGFIGGTRVSLDKESILGMRRFQVTNILGCANCFAKWHCRGGCIYAKKGSWFSPLPDLVCSLMRSIVREKILAVMNES